MVATAETTPIERIPLQKDEGGRKRPKVRTTARRPRRCAAAQKQGGRKKAAAPDSLLFAAEATFAVLTSVFAHWARCRIDAPRSLS